MIPMNIQKKLQANWGTPADAMKCDVECRIFDPHSSWEWFIYAQNPEDTDILIAIEHDFDIDAGVPISLSLLESLFNDHGDSMQFDYAFIPMPVSTILKRLTRTHHENFSRA